MKEYRPFPPPPLGTYWIADAHTIVADELVDAISKIRPDMQLRMSPETFRKIRTLKGWNGQYLWQSEFAYDTICGHRYEVEYPYQEPCRPSPFNPPPSRRSIFTVLFLSLWHWNRPRAGSMAERGWFIRHNLLPRSTF